MKHKNSNTNFIEPKVKILHCTPLFVAELAARTAYDSMKQSENIDIYNYKFGDDINNDIEYSSLVHNLAKVYHHKSVIEQIVITMHIKNIGRGVLQEHARHRIQSLTVKSTRYALNDVIYSYVIADKYFNENKYDVFDNLLREKNVLIIDNEELHKIETKTIFDKIKFEIGKDYNKVVSNSVSLSINSNELSGEPIEMLETLNMLPKKKNAGDILKHVVTDNFSTELVCSFNLRSLSNYIELRNSGAAWFQMHELAKKILDSIPEKYRVLI